MRNDTVYVGCKICKIYVSIGKPSLDNTNKRLDKFYEEHHKCSEKSKSYIYKFFQEIK